VFNISIKFKSLEEAKEVYGEGSLVPISFIKQIIFYAKHGVQPKFVYESEKDSGKVVGWYLKNETEYVHRKWKESKPTH